MLCKCHKIIKKDLVKLYSYNGDLSVVEIWQNNSRIFIAQFVKNKTSLLNYVMCLVSSNVYAIYPYLDSSHRYSNTWCSECNLISIPHALLPKLVYIYKYSAKMQEDIANCISNSIA